MQQEKLPVYEETLGVLAKLSIQGSNLESRSLRRQRYIGLNCWFDSRWSGRGETLVLRPDRMAQYVNSSIPDSMCRLLGGSW